MQADIISQPAAAFAERLISICDAHPNCPPLNKGRYTWVKEEFRRLTGRNLSTEAIRKWFSGEAWPKRDSVNTLAEILSVECSWLQGQNRVSKAEPIVGQLDTYRIAIEIRAGVRVELLGIPRDLKSSEARHLANLLLASATDIKDPQE